MDWIAHLHLVNPALGGDQPQGVQGVGLLPLLAADVELPEGFCFKLSVKNLIEFIRLK